MRGCGERNRRILSAARRAVCAVALLSSLSLLSFSTPLCEGFTIIVPPAAVVGSGTRPFARIRSVESSSTQLRAKTVKEIQDEMNKRRPNRRRRGAGNRSPSKVEDPDGPTPSLEMPEPELVDPNDVPGLREMMSEEEMPPGPIPHQPWRRGETAGCEAPIAAEWRRDAEEIIYRAVDIVGGRALDVTWYLTAVVVTLDPDVMPPKDFLKSSGPPVTVKQRTLPAYRDPDDPNPADIWADEEDVLYRRETPEEAAEARRKEINSYAKIDPDDPNQDPDEAHIPSEWDGEEPVPLYMNEETREDVVLGAVEERELHEAYVGQKMTNISKILVDTAALSTISESILTSLETVEDDLRILQRHELVLASPGSPDQLETQRQFDSYRGYDVVVQTVDPFNSNRTLKGKLVDRNSMDLIINKKGRMVTIPLNFVAAVICPGARSRAMEDGDDPTDEQLDQLQEEQEGVPQ